MPSKPTRLFHGHCVLRAGNYVYTRFIYALPTVYRYMKIIKKQKGRGELLSRNMTTRSGSGIALNIVYTNDYALMNMLYIYMPRFWRINSSLYTAWHEEIFYLRAHHVETRDLRGYDVSCLGSTNAYCAVAQLMRCKLSIILFMERHFSIYEKGSAHFLFLE